MLLVCVQSYTIVLISFNNLLHNETIALHSNQPITELIADFAGSFF